MLYRVEIQRAPGTMTRVMGEIREWLDAKRFEPDSFRCVTDADGIVFRLEFRSESQAQACAQRFEARLAF